MKKFLLVLSCFLATWCSVQAGLKCSTSGSELYGTSQSASMLMASAPAPTTTYPATINSATHKPEKGVIEVDFTVNTAGKVAFFLDGDKKSAWSQDCSRGGHKAYVPLKSVPRADVISITISVNGGICGGAGVHIIHIDPSVEINMVSHDAKNEIVTVQYSIINPKAEVCSLKVVKNDSRSTVVFKDTISSNLTAYALSSSIFKKGVGYRIEVSCGKELKKQDFVITEVPAGYIENVDFPMGGQVATFEYNLKNTYDPYIYIKKGGKYGTFVTKLKIYNTNGANTTVDLVDYRSILDFSTTYTACIYDVDAQGVEHDLGINKEFQYYRGGGGYLPLLSFDWHYNYGTKKLEVWATSSPLEKVNVWIYKNNSGNLSIHDFRSGKRGEVFKIGIPYKISQNYTIVVSSGSETKSITVCVGEH